MLRHTQAFDVYKPTESGPEEIYMSEGEEIFFSDKETDSEDHFVLSQVSLFPISRITKEMLRLINL